MIPMGLQARISPTGTVQGSTTLNTFCSRMRRAISCVYCEPKSRMTIVRPDIVLSYRTRVLSYRTRVLSYRTRSCVIGRSRYSQTFCRSDNRKLCYNKFSYSAEYVVGTRTSVTRCCGTDLRGRHLLPPRSSRILRLNSRPRNFHARAQGCSSSFCTADRLRHHDPRISYAPPERTAVAGQREI